MIEFIQSRLAARRNDEDRQGGFTLIELMVVVMIIAILVGIAIPAFLGARKRAQESAAKSNLRNALGTAQTIFSDGQAYGTTAALLANLISDEPSFTFIDGDLVAATASAKPKEVSVRALTSTIGTSGITDEVVLAAKSDSGKCFFVRHVATSGGTNLSGSWSTSTSSGVCNAASAPADDAASVAASATVWKPM